MVTRDLGGVHTIIEISGEIVAYELSENITFYEIPKSIKMSFQAADNQYALQMSLEPSYVWQNASNEMEYRKAIELYAFQKNHLSVITTGIPINWKFGKDFLRTAKNLGFLHEPKKVEILLRAFAETLFGENRRATHALRTSIGGNAKQKMRNKDEAWRRDIDYEYHLHYWKTPVGIEFASVVVHNDMSIPD